MSHMRTAIRSNVFGFPNWVLFGAFVRQENEVAVVVRACNAQPIVPAECLSAGAELKSLGW